MNREEYISKYASKGTILGKLKKAWSTPIRKANRVVKKVEARQAKFLKKDMPLYTNKVTGKHGPYIEHDLGMTGLDFHSRRVAKISKLRDKVRKGVERKRKAKKVAVAGVAAGGVGSIVIANKNSDG